jgi:hypothetical protein
MEADLITPSLVSMRRTTRNQRPDFRLGAGVAHPVAVRGIELILIKLGRRATPASKRRIEIQIRPTDAWAAVKFEGSDTGVAPVNHAQDPQAGITSNQCPTISIAITVRSSDLGRADENALRSSNNSLTKLIAGSCWHPFRNTDSRSSPYSQSFWLRASDKPSV